MKHFIPILSFLLFSSLMLSAQIRIDWQQCYGSLGEDRPRMITGTDQGIRIAGSCGGNDGIVTVELSPDKGWILDLDQEGTILNQQSPTMVPVGMVKAQDASGDLYLMGYSDNVLVTYYQHVSIIRQDASGVVKFRRDLEGGSFNLFAQQSAQGLLATPDGGVIGYCSIASNGGDISSYYGGWCTWIFKLNDSGELLWETTLGTKNGDEYASGLLLTSDGSLMALLSGNPSGNGSISGCDTASSDGIVVRLDQQGNIVGSQCYGGSGHESLRQVILLNDGYLLIGSTTSDDGDLQGAGFHQNDNGQQKQDAWLLKMDFDGNVMWSRCYGGSGVETVVKAFRNDDGGFTVFGTSDSNDGDVASAAALQAPWVPSIQRIWMFRTNSQGELLWERIIGTYISDTPLCDVLRHNDKEYTLLAQSWSMNNLPSGDYHCSNDEFLAVSHLNYWALRVSDIYNYNNLSEPTNKETTVKLTPNPVGNELSILFSPDVNPTRVELYDAQGRLVTSQAASLESVNTTDLKAGLYTVKVTFDDGKTYSDTVIKK